MSLLTLKNEMARLRQELATLRQANESPLLDRLRADPANVLALAGIQPDPWQAGLLRSQSRRILLLAARQTGKSTVSAAASLLTALLTPGATVLLLGPTHRQAVELHRKVHSLYVALGRPIATLGPRDCATRLELANESRVISLPAEPQNIRGFAADLVVLDEAGYVPDALYIAAVPMLAVTGGRLVAIGTPAGQRGWFHAEWTSGGESWQRFRVTAESCRRISREFLAEQRRTLGRWYDQEFGLAWLDAVDAVFSIEDIGAACQGGGDVKARPWPE